MFFEQQVYVGKYDPQPGKSCPPQMLWLSTAGNNPTITTMKQGFPGDFTTGLHLADLSPVPALGLI
jgi:hypothetical protein